MEHNGERWSPREGADLYGIESWWRGCSRVGPGGTVEVLPDQWPEGSVDLLEIVEGLQATPPVHALRLGEPYYLGAFLVGVIEALIEGDTVREIPRYVQFDPEAFLASFRRGVERAMREGRLELHEGRQLVRFYREGLNGYTCLEEG